MSFLIVCQQRSPRLLRKRWARWIEQTIDFKRAENYPVFKAKIENPEKSNT